jgi:Holliday junction resolvase RusA-like endonuclease
MGSNTGKTTPQHIIFKTRLPTLNAYILLERGHWRAAAAKKKKVEASLVWEITAQKIQPVTDCPVNIIYHFYCKDRRQDKRNVSFVVKFIEDALQTAGLIVDDGWKYIDYPEADGFYIDKANPRVEVFIG